MEDFDRIREKLCLELEEIARKPEMSAGDLEALHKLTDTLKNTYKIEIYEGEAGYSQRGSGREGNRQRGSYNGGNSYANRGEHYVRGHYSRNGYSRSGMMEHLERMMDEARTDKEREAIRRCMEQIDT